MGVVPSSEFQSRRIDELEAEVRRLTMNADTHRKTAQDYKRWLDESNAEVERLKVLIENNRLGYRLEVERLREALTQIAKVSEGWDIPGAHPNLIAVPQIAREALNGKESP